MLEVLFIGLSLGSILLLVALGLAITYGAMGVINMAHGEMVMIGAYVTVLSGIWLGTNIFIAIPLAFIVTALLGLLIERVVVRRLYGRLLDTLLATWGIAILIQQAVRLEFGLSFFGIHIQGLGPGLQNVSVPEFLQGTFSIAGADINRYRTFIILVTAILAVVTWFIIYRTSIGTQVRAIIRNPKMAAACGIDVTRINALTFAFGSGLAGVAGVMMSGFKTVFPDMGTPMVVDGFLVVVMGGVGSLLGSVLSAGILGEINGLVACRDQRYPGARRGVWRGDRDHRAQAEGPVRPEGPLTMLSKRRIDWAIYAAFVVLIMVAPLVMEPFWLNRIAKYLVFGMVGVAVALSWGYAGILNLGQGLFFGAGAYMLAMSLKLASQTSLQQGSDKPVPDFMLWNAEPGAPTELCCINKASFLWLPFQNQWFGVAMGLILPVAIAGLIGTIVFRKRISGVFVSIITLALVLLVRLVVIDAQPVTNGFNGLTDLGWFKVMGLEFDPYIVPTYYLVAVSLSLVLVGARLLVETRAGIILQAVRDDQNRARYLGFDVTSYQTFFFAVSAAITGFAGMLYVIVSEFASPTFMDLTFSITMVVWAAVGGRSSILGACIGAIIINLISATVSETAGFAEAWKAIIGLIFVLVVLYLPRGLAGLAHDLVDRVVTRKSNGSARVLRVTDPSSQLAE